MTPRIEAREVFWDWTELLFLIQKGGLFERVRSLQRPEICIWAAPISREARGYVAEGVRPPGEIQRF